MVICQRLQRHLDNLLYLWRGGRINFNQYIALYQRATRGMSDAPLPEPPEGYIWVLNDGNDCQVSTTFNGKEYDLYDVKYSGGGQGAPCA